jgi:biofilm protein TabA
MIIDHLENLKKYSCIPHLELILGFLSNTNILELPVGDIAIKGEDLFVKVLRYIPKDSKDLYFETHENYADLQLVIFGLEAMHVVDSKYLENTNDFKMEGDFVFYKATESISELVVPRNKFVVFFPGEAHKPGCLYNNSNEIVQKLVFKIRI